MVNKYSVYWTPEAKSDLKPIFEYISRVESRRHALYVIAGINGVKRKIITRDVAVSYVPCYTLVYIAEVKRTINFYPGLLPVVHPSNVRLDFSSASFGAYYFAYPYVVLDTSGIVPV